MRSWLCSCLVAITSAVAATRRNSLLDQVPSCQLAGGALASQPSVVDTRRQEKTDMMAVAVRDTHPNDMVGSLQRAVQHSHLVSREGVRPPVRLQSCHLASCVRDDQRNLLDQNSKPLEQGLVLLKDRTRGFQRGGRGCCGCFHIIFLC